MLRTILSPQVFRKGMDLYFERHDGHAATVEDFIRCFEEVSGRKLDQFRLWYSQAGTPEIRAEAKYDAAASKYTLNLSQHIPATPGQPEKQPMQIPLTMALIGSRSGAAMPLALEGENQVGPTERVVELTRAEHQFVFTNISEPPVLSIARDFSAPVIIRSSADPATRAFLMSRDTDAFNRWESGQQLATEILLAMISDVQSGRPANPDRIYIDALGNVLNRADEDHAFTALMLMPPSESELALKISPIDPEAIHNAREVLIRAAADTHRGTFQKLYDSLRTTGPFSPDAASAGRRALRNTVLRYLTAGDDQAAAELAYDHFQRATNMTETTAGLAALARMAQPQRETAFAAFHDRVRSDPLVLDKWMGLQAMSPLPDTIARVRSLMAHPVFTLKNPNRVRALIGAFAVGNPLRFHDRSGGGYRLLREVVQALDSINPQTAARMAAAFETWRRYDPERQRLIRAELEAIASGPGLSNNLYEMVSKMLG
jgi:aminopeptidase N